MRTSSAGIAQLVEQLTCNQKVPSSTLGAGTIKQKQPDPSGQAVLLCLKFCRESP